VRGGFPHYLSSLRSFMNSLFDQPSAKGDRVMAGMSRKIQYTILPLT
jgi:hypothetical protein